ncbi:MAG: cation transporter [Bacteroidales bacterium]|nr:cation transporter [Bacteroidales bacterium]
MKKVLIFVAIFAMTFTMFAQQQAKTQTVTIQTNGTCAQCKKIMMDNIPQWPGVKECSYDMQTAKVTITYETRGTDVDKLREGIRLLGYDADHIKADPEARAKLPKCCTTPNNSAGNGCGGCGHHH